jgi:hypothetical protein
VIPHELLQDESDRASRLSALDELFAGQPVSARADAEAEIQAETESALIAVSEQTVLSSSSTMYRHHPSGIDRWFSSHHARSAPAGSGCDTRVLLDDGGPIEPIPAPQLIPPLLADGQPSTLPDDVADAVRRALSAIETATKTIGPAPKGFVRSRH